MELTLELLVEMADQGKSPSDIARELGVSRSVVYKKIRQHSLKERFSQYVVRCRDVCPALIRIMALTGANLHTIHRVAYPEINYPRLMRFIKRESMAHYFDTEPFTVIQWAEPTPPLYSIEQLAEKVVKNSGSREMYLNGGPCWKTVSKRFHVSNWEDAQKFASKILEISAN